MARDRTPTFGTLVDARLADPQARARPSVLRQLGPAYRTDELFGLGPAYRTDELFGLGPAYRTDELFGLVADLNDAVVAHDRPEGARGRVGDDAVREAALAVAVEAARLWLASTGWPEGTPEAGDG